MATTFTYETPGTYDAETRTWSTPTVTSMTGAAFESGRLTERYRMQGLIEQDDKVLIFVPTTYGDQPGVGWEVTWANKDYTVKDVGRVAPDGVVIFSRVVIGR